MLVWGKLLMYTVARGIMDNLYILSKAYLNSISYSIHQIRIENYTSGNSEFKTMLLEQFRVIHLCIIKY